MQGAGNYHQYLGCPEHQRRCSKSCGDGRWDVLVGSGTWHVIPFT